MKVRTPQEARIDRLYGSRGGRRGRDWVGRNFPDAAHNEPAWRARVDVPLRFLVAAKPTP